MIQSYQIINLTLILCIMLLAMPIHVGWQEFYIHTWLPGHPTKRNIERYFKSLPVDAEGVECMLEFKNDRMYHDYCCQRFSSYLFTYKLKCCLWILLYMNYIALSPVLVYVLTIRLL
jgi:hypothetical protein